ncbi:MAG: hypothetical protein VB106_21435 [Clostridiaceae bacterium]|nr:hypothetical protein [Clostridiaceae bacterium]
MKRWHFFWTIIFLILIILYTTGCNMKSVSHIKENGTAVKEYNRAIEIYNKIAISFTSLARAVEKEPEETEPFDEKFWKNYENSEKKVLDNISNMRGLEFKYSDIEKVMVKINPMLKGMEAYLERVEEFQKLEQYSDWKDFKESMDILYREILNQSSEISKTFDEIYDEFIIKEKD